MGFENIKDDIYGFQFHPESFLTKNGKLLIKKSYQRNTLKEIKFNDLWNKNGVFTTMWIYSKPPKILFFKSHIQNLIKSLKAYKISEDNIKNIILNLIKKNIIKKFLTIIYSELL